MENGDTQSIQIYHPGSWGLRPPMPWWPKMDAPGRESAASMGMMMPELHVSRSSVETAQSDSTHSAAGFEIASKGKSRA